MKKIIRKKPEFQFIKKISKKINKNIYLELFAWIITSIFICIVFFIFCVAIFKSNGMFKQKHVDFNNARQEQTEDIYYFIEDLYENGIENQDSYIKEKIQNLNGEVYITDAYGNVNYSNTKDAFSVMQINLDTWDNQINHSNKQETFIAKYPLLINDEIHYVLQRCQLIGDTSYSNEELFILSGGMTLLLFLFLIFMGTRKKIAYIKYLGESVETISKSNLNYVVEVKGSDQLAIIADKMNEMEEKIKNKIEAEEKSYRENQELITNLSHDLKTPLTIISGYLDILKNRQYKNEEEHESYIQIAYNKVLELNEMVLKLFELIKSGKGVQSLILSDVNFTRLFRQICMEYQSLANEKELELTFSMPKKDIFINADVTKITSVFSNLFDNALKYCSEHGKINAMIENEDDSILIIIANTYPYIEANEIDNLFKKFYRGDKARNSKIQGNGVGLAVVKNIVEIHNGQVWAEFNNDNVVFKVRLRRF